MYGTDEVWVLTDQCSIDVELKLKHFPDISARAFVGGYV